MDLTIFSLSSGNQPIELNDFPSGCSIDDVTQSLPQGVYSTFRTYGGQKVLELQAHLDRLYNPALKNGISPSVSALELRQQLRELLIQFQPVDTKIRISLSLDDNPGQVFVMIERMKLIPEEIYQLGVNLVTVNLNRATPRLKSTRFIQASSEERKTTLDHGFYEALMVQKSRIFEGLTSNFYAIRSGKIITARYGILLGVTRKVVLRVARVNKLKVEYRPLRIDEIPSIEEAFITSSSRGIMPVVEIDGMKVGQGTPGALTSILRNSFESYVCKKAANI